MAAKRKEEEANIAYTEPVETPQHPHAKYKYEYGDMRRCHLCGSPESHMDSSNDAVWFATLEDRARHVLECHREYAVEVQRAKEILAIADLWDSSATKVEQGEKKNTIFKIPSLGSQSKASIPTKSMNDKEETQSWFAQHRLLTLILVGVIIYAVYCMYKLSQGYTF